MNRRTLPFARTLCAAFACALVLVASPALALQPAGGAAPEVVSGLVVSADARIVPETGVILTDVGVLETLPDGTTAATTFTMAGGVVGDFGMWTEQYTELRPGDFVVAGISDEGGSKTTVAAPVSSRGLSSSSVPGLDSQVDAIAAGYIWDGLHWDDSTLPITYYINPSGLPADSVSAITAATQVWEDDPNSYMDFTYAGTTGTSPGISDDVNVIGAGTPKSTTAIAECTCWYYPTTKQIVEFDIVYNAGRFAFATDGSGSAYDMQGIGTHEAGHILHLVDLYDSENSNQTMYGYGTAGDTSQRTIEWGDRAGIYAIYPSSGSVTYTLSGTVTNAGGTPLPGVSVSVSGGGSAATGGSGTYSISGLAAATYSVTYSLAGYTAQTVSVGIAGNTTRNIALQAIPATTYTLSGFVTNASGAPLSGVSVSVSGGGSTTTDGTGAYSISGLAAGTYSVTYSLGGYTTQALSIAVAANTTRSIALALSPTTITYSLSGTVSDSGGTPLSGVQVAVGSTASGTTNGSGFYTVSGIAAGTYSVTYSLAGYVTQTQSVSILSNTSRPVVLASAPSGSKFTLSGSVRDSADYAFLQGVQVQIGSAATVITDALGQFSVAGIPAGNYTITYSLAGYVPRSESVSLLSNTALTAFLTPLPISFSGRVVDTAGYPVPLVLVDVGGIANGYTSSEGRFSIDGLHLGTRSVTYSSPGWVTRVIETAFTGGPVDAGDVVLLRVPSSLSISAAARVKKNKYLKVSGTLTPVHADGAYSVRIYRWRLSKSKWKSYPYLVAWTTNANGATKYSKSIKFAYTGKWRIRASHSADGKHSNAPTSAYDYVTVY